MIDFYSAAAQSFQEDLDRIERDGRKDSSDWYLAKGLLQLTQDCNKLVMRSKICGSRSRDPGRHGTNGTDATRDRRNGG